MRSLTVYLGLFLIVIGLPILFASTSVNADIPLLIGLFTLFISSQAREDERSGAIRTSSAFIAIILGYSLKLVITNLYLHHLISFDLTSINYFLIIVFSLANIIRYSRLYIFMT